jgi:hypothetical protein
MLAEFADYVLRSSYNSVSGAVDFDLVDTLLACTRDFVLKRACHGKKHNVDAAVSLNSVESLGLREELMLKEQPLNIEVQGSVDEARKVSRARKRANYRANRRARKAGSVTSTGDSGCRVSSYEEEKLRMEKDRHERRLRFEEMRTTAYVDSLKAGNQRADNRVGSVRVKIVGKNGSAVSGTSDAIDAIKKTVSDIFPNDSVSNTPAPEPLSFSEIVKKEIQAGKTVEDLVGEIEYHRPSSSDPSRALWSDYDPNNGKGSISDTGLNDYMVGLTGKFLSNISVQTKRK